MQAEESIAVRRPQRWSEPMDASMNDADVSWLRSRDPFALMDAKAFPRTIPLEGILRNDCRIQRCEPGEIVVREGDYGNSAFLVLAGSVKVIVDSLAPSQLGRTPTKKLTWTESLYRYLFRSKYAESRKPSEVTTNFGDGKDAQSIRQVDDRAAIFLQDFNAILTNSNTVELGPGELFGEVAAMYRSPRTATVVAETEATLLEIRWQGLRVLRRDKPFADSLDQHYRTHWLTVHLREVPLLRHLPESSLARVTAATQMRSFGRMEWNADYARSRELPVNEQIETEPLVAREGNTPTDLIIVRSGFGRLSQEYGASHRTTAYLGKGHVYGLEELAYNSLRPTESPLLPLQRSLRAVGFLDVLMIPAETFATEILPHVRRSELPELAAELMIQPTGATPGAEQDRRRISRAEQTDKADFSDQETSVGQKFESTELLEFIVQNRLNNGRQAMVIDLHRCTRCDDCVRACAATHDGNPRFIRHGAQVGRFMIANACMHCVDPVCMIGCPTGAIHRVSLGGEVAINDPTCIGCGTCATNCPYENIRLVEVRDKTGALVRDADTRAPIQKATKCDLCVDQQVSPACERACPHDALRRVDMRQTQTLLELLES
jgi:Fe-S-cluster-containing dehydrogenase component/CRP-like cAMP-binding protein